MRLLISSVVLAALLLTVPSCTRKGEDDPLVSLRTRKNRITGQWTLSAANGTATQSYQYGSALLWDFADGTEIYYDASNGQKVDEQFFSCSFDLNPDQTFEWKMQETGSANPGIMKGTWDFLASSDTDRKKTKLILIPQSISGEWPSRSNLSFALCESTPLFTISELRNKQLTISRNFQLPGQSTTTGRSHDVYENYTFIQD
ncbi:MAG: hypothetical protein ACRC3B_02630 [Bacteroidia bacterium]